MISDLQRGIRRSDRFDFAVEQQPLVLDPHVEYGELE
jgi:hypothetical protein